MRQGGFKPKSHSSGTYWVRANAKNGGSKTQEKLEGDVNGDGIVDQWDIRETVTIQICRILGIVGAIVIVILALIF